MKNLYKFSIVEHNGEQEYWETRYVWADDENEANNLASEYGAEWYEDAIETGHNEWEIDCLSWVVTKAKLVEFIEVGVINGFDLCFYPKNGVDKNSLL